ncbi:amino acid adenylation domain-containing protein [Spirosoma radiotolerans]|uniref:Carrier domain-containing protein n=1 Tax=Spirosoma radiotolerans TaxID=1379870 RepID=A0A0E3ZT92_9BACT|nr:non-ribosomal peptide synthetase [Spirosoma radiotolerans]AKD53909.1 hypothetical protein SD10_02315 [Spirosoma radiotolerans]
MVYKLIDEQAIQMPDKVAIEAQDGTATYRAIYEKSNQIAHLLLQSATEHQAIIGVVLSPGIDLVQSLIGIFKAGAIYLPIDKEFASKRLADMFQQSPCHTIITSADYKEEVDIMLRLYSPQTRQVIVMEEEGPVCFKVINHQWEKVSMNPVSTASPDVDVQPDDANYLFYTSGSTGTPKPILGCHKSLTHFINWEMGEFKLDSSCRVSQLAQFTFDASLRDIFVPLCAGGTLCIPSAEIKLNYARLIDWIGRSEITLMHSVPSLFRMIVKELSQGSISPRFEKLRYYLLAGEPLFATDILNWRHVANTTTELVNLYGPSETTMVKTFHRVGHRPISPTESIPAGLPIANTFIAIINSSNKLCKVGEKGEIFIRTPYMTKGYYGNEALTKQVFVQNPLVSDFEDIVYKTGDLGRYLPDRSVELLGRIDDQVKINGIRVEPEEIRKTVLVLPGITEAYVTAVKNTDNVNELVCYYTGHPYADVELRQQLKASLTEYLIPAYFVHLPAFPLNANGKIEKKALPKPNELVLKGLVYEPCQGGIEETLEAVWQEVLGLERIGRKASFFEVGGTSLKATQIVTRIYQKLKASVSIKDLFTKPTIAELANHINNLILEQDTSIRKIAEQPYYDVSHGQRRLWVLSQLEDDSAAYNMTASYEIRGELTISAVQQAFDQVIARHESLRTTFFFHQGELKQKIHQDTNGFAVDYVDLANASTDVTDERIRQMALTSFDLEQGPLLKVALIKTAEQTYRLMLAIHHIITDGWSMEVMIREMLAFYQAADAGSEPLPRPLNVQYKDFAAWQNEQLSGDRLLRHKAYWQTKLSGPLPVLELPADRPRPALKTFDGDTVDISFPGRNVAAFAELCQKQQVSLHMGILSLVYALFYRYTGSSDIILGTPSAGRLHKELEGQIGYYVNLLALRTTFAGTDSFAELLQQVKDTTLGAYEHQLYPFDKLVEDLRVTRELSRSPLFDVAVILHNTSIREEEVNQINTIQVQPLKPQVRVSKYDLQFNFYAVADSLTLSIDYNTSLFNRGRMERMLLHLAQLMQIVVEQPGAPVSGIDYLTAREKQHLLYDWNYTDKPYAQEKLLHQLFEQQASLNPRHVAVTCHGQSLTYQELNQFANQLARHLLKGGMNNGDNVALIADRTPLMLVGLLGILKAGGAYVPIDPTYPVDRQLYICQNSDVKFLLSDAAYAVLDSLPEQVVQLPLSTREYGHYEGTNLNIRKSTRDLAYTIYTSGSTGRPKGVMIEHHSAINLIEWVNHTYAVTKNDRLLFITSMCFDLSVYDIFGILAVGATVVMATQDDIRNVDRLKDLMVREQITFWDSVPTSMNHLIAALEDSGESYSQPFLRVVFMSGDWIPVDLPERINVYHPNASVVSLGGATEGTVWSNYYPVMQSMKGWSSVPYGRPLDNNYFYILDEQLNPVPQGIPGELFIGGVGVARGYANDPEKTAKAFLNNPFLPSPMQRMYRTGDLGRLMEDGNMEFLGRKDHQIKIRGFRVEIGEVNTTLAQHPAITEAIVVAKGDRNAMYLIAYYASRGLVDTRELKSYLSGFLPDYMIPAFFVQLDKLPMNANGKIDHKALPDPDESRLNEVAFTVPSTVTETRLLTIWQQVLRSEKISSTDDFFSVGGHSLNATRVLSRIQKELGVRMELRSMFLFPTISAMAQEIDRTLGKSADLIESVPVQDGYELSHAQKQLWLLNQASKKDLSYVIPFAFEVQGDLNVTAFEKAIHTLIDRHEILRTVFVVREGQPRQRVLDRTALGFTLTQVDLRLAPQPRAEAIQMAEEQPPFDLETGPLLRATLIQLSHDQWMFLFSIHHIISDAWSMGVIINELTAAYNAYTLDEELALEPLSVQYKDYVYWHKKQLAADRLETLRSYWLTQLGGALPVLNLDTDFERPALQSTNGATQLMDVPEDLFGRVGELAIKEGVSPFILLTTALKALLYRYTGQQDILIGTVISGRDQYQLDNQIGFYVNTLALRTTFDGKGTGSELLQAVKQTILDAYEHQLYPFDQLITDLKLQRDRSRSPLFDIGIEYQHLAMQEGEVKEWNGITLQPFDTLNRISKHDLSFRFFESNNTLKIGLVYNTDLYLPDTVVRLGNRFLNMLTAIVNNPAVKLEDVSLNDANSLDLVNSSALNELFNFNF